MAAVSLREGRDRASAWLPWGVRSARRSDGPTAPSREGGGAVAAWIASGCRHCCASRERCRANVAERADCRTHRGRGSGSARWRSALDVGIRPVQNFSPVGLALDLGIPAIRTGIEPMSESHWGSLRTTRSTPASRFPRAVTSLPLSPPAPRAVLPSPVPAVRGARRTHRKLRPARVVTRISGARKPRRPAVLQVSSPVGDRDLNC